MGRIAPYLLYEDGAAAIDFLTKAFGFEEVMRMEEGGVVNHAEVRLGDDSVMLGYPGADYKNPKNAGYSSALVHVYVDDVDSHFERAQARRSRDHHGADRPGVRRPALRRQGPRRPLLVVRNVDLGLACASR